MIIWHLSLEEQLVFSFGHTSRQLSVIETHLLNSVIRREVTNWSPLEGRTRQRHSWLTLVQCLLNEAGPASLSLFSRYKMLFHGCSRHRVCLWLCEMKYCSHKKWLSSLSSTALHNDGPVQAETRGIVTRQHTHIWSPEDSLGVEGPCSVLTTTSHTGLWVFFST